MSILLLSDANIRAIKNVLMTNYEVGSAHSSELIAALSGFKSYSALQLALKDLEFPPAVEIDTNSFENRHAQLGYDRESGEWMHFSFATLQLPDRPWLIHSTNQSYLRNSWFDYCSKHSLPFITIHRKRKYCYLEWDCISIDPKYEGHVRNDKGDELGRKLFRLYQLCARGNESKSYYLGSSFYGTIKKLSEGAAREMANEFFMQLTPWQITQ